jgi:hypothetical protein
VLRYTNSAGEVLLLYVGSPQDGQREASGRAARLVKGNAGLYPALFNQKQTL